MVDDFLFLFLETKARLVVIFKYCCLVFSVVEIRI